MFLRKQVLSAVLVVLTLFPALASARVITDIVDTSAAAVTRANFLSWTFEALKFSKSEGDCRLPWARVPRGMKPTLCAALPLGALDAFGTSKTYPLARPVTRGEALLVLTALMGRSESADVSAFRDVKTAAQTRAVQNAVALRWMVPASATSFGLSKPLTGAETLSLLQAVTGENPGRKQMTVTIGGSSDLPSEQLMATVWQLLKEYHLHADQISEEEAAYRAIEGMVASLEDPYTNFFRPVEAANFAQTIKGEVTGIGAHIEDKAGIVTVVAPLPNSPAERAGILPGDQILEANGVPLQGIGIEKAAMQIRGERGTKVDLKIRRNGADMMVSVIRDTVKIPEINVKWEGDIAIVELLQFGEITTKEIRSVFTDIQKKNPRGIVLDLRNNGGGLLSAAELVLSNFVPRGTTFAQVKNRTETNLEKTDDEPTVNSSTKMVVLVNKGSASASEIVAGALQDLKRATIVGATTFGKGSVQNLIERIGPKDEGLKITIAEWLTPLGRHIHEVGVVPDVVVDAEEKNDALKQEQFRRALEILRQ